MRKPVFSVTLVLLLLAGLVVATGAAGAEEVEVTLWWDGDTTIAAGEVAVLRAGWAACTRGLVRTAIVASNFEVTLDGDVILTAEDVDGLWLKTEIMDPEPGWKELCLGNGQPAWAEWRFSLPDLEPGVHEVTCEIWMDRTIFDGTDQDGEPGPDRFPPELFDRNTINTIIVE